METDNVKILVVDPVGEMGHVKFNKSILEALSSRYDVEFLSTKGYSDLGKNICDYSVFPHSIFDSFTNKYFSRIVLYLRSLFAVTYSKKNNFDVLYFITFETISLSLVPLKNTKVWLHNHNNIDDMLKSKFKSYLFGFLSRRASLLVIEEYMADFLSTRYNCDVYTIPHPSFLTDSGRVYDSTGKIVFSPSGTYDSFLMDELEKTATEQDFVLWAKGKVEKETENVVKKKYFHDYEERIQNASVIFIINKISYRVAGIMYEALSFGKTVVGIDSLFMREIKKQYPNLVYIVDDISSINACDIENWSQTSGRLEEYIDFVEKHSIENIAISFEALVEKKHC